MIQRKLKSIDKIIIHCAAAETASFSTVKRWHLKRGFDTIGYHYYINKAGDTVIGRELHQVGAHCKGQNRKSIGICLEGDKEFTPIQFTTLKKLVDALRVVLNDEVLFSYPHCRYNENKTCPNFDVSFLDDDIW